MVTDKLTKGDLMSFKLMSFLLLVALTPQFSQAQIQGYVDRIIETNSQLHVAGWACDTKVNKSVGVHMYVDNIYIAGRSANLSGEKAISTKCGTNIAAHRFLIPITDSMMQKHAGKKISVFGISTKKQNNNKLSNSGSLVIPELKKVKPETVKLVAKTLIKDSNFENGFNSTLNLKPTSNKSFETLKANCRINNSCDKKTDTIWNATYWYSNTVLKDRSMNQLNSNTVKWSTGDKALELDLRNKEVTMSVNTVNDYKGKHRSKSDPWVHFLLEQRISNPQNENQQSSPISDMQKLILNLNLKMDYNSNQNNSARGYNRSTHTQQFVLFFTVQNLNKRSSSFGEYVWLGVPLFEDREKMPKGVRHIDKGTNSLIYSVPYSDHSSRSIHEKEWQKINFDLLPYAKDALEYAIANNILKSKNLSDYKIGSMNTGYETTGLYITTIKLKSLQLTEYTKK